MKAGTQSYGVNETGPMNFPSTACNLDPLRVHPGAIASIVRLGQ